MRLLLVLLLASFFVGCDQGNDRLAEKARIEGREQALAEIKAQIDEKDKLIEKARNEGRAVAEAELKAQVDNIDLITQKARAEGRAAAEAELNATNANLAYKAGLMEEDLATRQLFYRAVRGTYEGALSTESGEFKIRITLVPSIPPYVVPRVRQLEEITHDINALYFNAQVVQWNPSNKLSAVGCRVENIRPDIIRGEIQIASKDCPNLYLLKIADVETAKALNQANGKIPSDSELSAAVAESIREGKMSELPEIRGEVHPSTNASIYSLTVKRASR